MCLIESPHRIIFPIQQSHSLAGSEHLTAKDALP